MNPDHAHPDHAHPEHARPEAGGRSARPPGTAVSEVGASLEAVCRSVTELARTAPKPPRRIRLQAGQTHVEVEWPDPHRAAVAQVSSADAAESGDEPDAPAAEAGDQLTHVRAPMVGTFYHAGSPVSPPFVQVGDVVQQGQQVGVLEAMKMMNSVTATASGRVVELLAANAQRVEFDEPLIALEPVAAAAAEGGSGAEGA